MHPPVRTALTLTGCIAALVATGGMAVLALRSTGAPGTQQATATVVVDDNEAGGTARLTVLDAVRIGAGGRSQTLPAGTEFTTTSDTLAASFPAAAADVSATGAAPGPTVGATLSCDLLVRLDGNQPVIDLVRCSRTTTTARG